MHTKTKWINLGLLLSSLIVYLEWGDNQQFLGGMEIELLAKLFSEPQNVLHPFTILPLAGQILLLVTLFRKGKSKLLSILGLSLLGLLIYFITFIDFLGQIKSLLSTLPFVGLSIWSILTHIRRKN